MHILFESKSKLTKICLKIMCSKSSKFYNFPVIYQILPHSYTVGKLAKLLGNPICSWLSARKKFRGEDNRPLFLKQLAIVSIVMFF